MKINNESQLFDLFCENTNLNDKNIVSFIRNFENDSLETSKIKYPTIDLKLKYPKDKLFNLMCKRSSERNYTNYKLRKKEIDSLFSCFAEINSHRLLPSAGGKYPIEVYALCFNTQSIINQKIVYYNYDSNSLSIIGECPNWDVIKYSLGCADNVSGTPSILFLFVGFPERTCLKYGDRGGRFLFIEAGHYLQNLNLRVIQENLKAVELGGIYDNEMKKILKLEKTNTIITLGMLCGK